MGWQRTFTAIVIGKSPVAVQSDANFPALARFELIPVKFDRSGMGKDEGMADAKNVIRLYEGSQENTD